MLTGSGNGSVGAIEAYKANGALLWTLPIFDTNVYLRFTIADIDRDGFLSGDDFDQYVAAFELGESTADFNCDGFVSGDDFDLFVADFVSGC